MKLQTTRYKSCLAEDANIPVRDSWREEKERSCSYSSSRVVRGWRQRLLNSFLETKAHAASSITLPQTFFEVFPQTKISDYQELSRNLLQEEIAVIFHHPQPH